MMGWYGGGMGVGAWFFMGLFWIALIATVIWLVIRLLPSNGRAGTTPHASTERMSALPAQESSLDVLDRRFAQGDIDLETYQAHRAALIEARGGTR